MDKLVEPDVDAFGSLVELESGNLNPAQARAQIATILEARIDAEVGSEIYASMRTWIGRLTRGSAHPDDLRAWYNLLKTTSAQFQGDLHEWAIRLSVLGELVFERVSMAETRDIASVLSRRHARAIINELAGEPKGRLSRTTLLTRLGLEQANLSRVCTLLLDAGLITRFEEGRTVSYGLSSDGVAVARSAKETPLEASAVEPQGADWEVLAERETSTASHLLDEWARYDSPVPEIPVLDYRMAA